MSSILKAGGGRNSNNIIKAHCVKAVKVVEKEVIKEVEKEVLVSADSVFFDRGSHSLSDLSPLKAKNYSTTLSFSYTFPKELSFTPVRVFMNVTEFFDNSYAQTANYWGTIGLCDTWNSGHASAPSFASSNPTYVMLQNNAERSLTIRNIDARNRNNGIAVVTARFYNVVLDKTKISFNILVTAFRTVAPGYNMYIRLYYGRYFYILGI